MSKPSRRRQIPKDIPETFKRAVALHRQGRLEEAMQLYSSLLSAKPDHFGALHRLGVLQRQRGNAVEALRLITAALAVNPRSPDALSNLGLAYAALKRFDEAIGSYEQAIAIKSDHFDAIYHRGIALRSLERHQEALAAFKRALELKPDHMGALNESGNVLLETGQPKAAIANYDQALSLQPDFIHALTNRGIALRRLKRLDEALINFDRALAIDPDNVSAINSRGNVLRDLGRFEESLKCFDRLLALKPNDGNVLNNRGGVLMDIGRQQEAAACFEKAVALQPSHAEARLNDGVTRLRFGDYEKGWRQYEARWQMKDRIQLRRNFQQPLWLGDTPLEGKTILLHAEQGHGDTIQFARYAKLAAQKGATVILEVQPALKTLLSPIEGASLVVAAGEPLPPFDLHCPFMSLPLAFGTKLDTIPADIPYLRADAEKIETWRARLGEPAGLQIGLAWSGSPTQRSDRRRSISLRNYAPLVALPNVRCVSLQLGLSEDDAEFVKDHPNILHFGDNFAETAAIISLLDVVISVDTSLAHLAGALGKPVWILLAYSADFRWLLEREDSPWYPTVRLFRQPQADDWDSVMERVGAELMKLIERESPSKQLSEPIGRLDSAR